MLGAARIRYSFTDASDTIPRILCGLPGQNISFDGRSLTYSDSGSKRYAVSRVLSNEALDWMSSFLLVSDALIFHKRSLANSDLLDNCKSVTTLGTEIIDGMECSVTEIAYPENELSSDARIRLSISLRDMLLRRKETIMQTNQYGNGYQYTCAEIYDFQVQPTLRDLEARPAPPAGYTAVEDIHKVQEPANGVVPLPKGTSVPDIPVLTMAGDSTMLSTVISGISVLYFWRMGCVPTEMSKPYVISLAKKYSSRGVTFLGINNVDTDTDAVSHYLRSKPLRFPSVFISSKNAEILGVRGNPRILVLDGRKTVLDFIPGYYEGFHKDLDQLLSKQLARKAKKGSTKNSKHTK
jgi:thiol-disulfide isomerase/thioredoxin